MYINPFLLGVLTTIGVEMLIIFIVGLVSVIVEDSHKEDDNNETK